MDPTDFTLCDKASDLAEVTKSLQGASTLFLDCEGQNLGSKGGTLSLISLGIPAPKKARIYLIDTIALGTLALRPIFNILESSDVQKVLFDARMDQSVLFHDHGGVKMQNVLDLQLADVRSRVVRGEEAESVEQLMRLCPYLPRNEVHSNPSLYGTVHKLAGLDKAIKEHEVDVTSKELEVKAHFSHTSWLNRPLPKTHLTYAANDIDLISRLWSKFVEEGYIDAKLVEQSLRYAHIWTVGSQPAAEDVFKLHALLPLAILDAPASTTQRCLGCERYLHRGCYSKVAWNQAAKRKCLVCRAIGIRLAREEAIQKAREDDWYSD
ncbi:ribonuclease H-like domain-containing protein [Mycena epipterygia]|nr:ribonuclease H-like domain-containing protein [Mycena epipterygia]